MKGWYGNSQKHSLASKGIKSSLSDFRKRIFATKTDIHEYIKTFKNKNASVFAKKFNEFINPSFKTTPKISFEEKSVKWNFTPLGSNHYYKDDYGHSWEEIKIYDKKNNFIRAMRKYVTSGSGIKSGKTNTVINFLEKCPEKNITYEETCSKTNTFVKIYYRGNSFKEINMIRSSIDNKLKKEIGIKAFKRG